MNTAQIALMCRGADFNSCMKPTEKEIELWDEILKQHDLPMEKGFDPFHLGYGAKYFDTSKVCDYISPGSYNTQKNKGKSLAEQLLALMNQGMSMIKAAKEVGMSKGNASVCLKRYRANFARSAEPNSIEDEHVD